MDDYQFDQLCLISTPANRARLLSVASCHASSWLAVIPSSGINLSLDPDEFQVALKWWLGMDTSSQLRCPYCPDHQLDPLGHHALTCKGGGDVVLSHNSLRDVFAQFCHRARLGGQLEVGHGFGGESLLSRPADILEYLLQLIIYKLILCCCHFYTLYFSIISVFIKCTCDLLIY